MGAMELGPWIPDLVLSTSTSPDWVKIRLEPINDS